jgi:multiple RNA-binding domain-containing protein 1
LDKSIFQGRILEIVAAKDKPEFADEIQASNPSNFKSKREAEMKQKASNDFNWNSLFMNSDAVAEAMARNLGVRKSEILDASSSDMAVRLALAETNIITETKEYLENQGVSLESFMGKRTRSNTIILVKNIPAATEEEDLVSSFSEFGELNRIILPPARTIALVEYALRNEAKVAFRKLAYSKFKGVPLYLEWAPEGTFLNDYDPNQVAAKKNDLTKKIAATPEIEELPPAATIFVKNLNFETTDEVLKAAFEGLNGLRSARISKKSNPKYPGQKMSMGFGFLEFQTKEDAMKCIKTMQVFEQPKNLEISFGWP